MKLKGKTIVGLLLLVNLCSVTATSGDEMFGPTTPAANGWSQSDWFGWYYEPYDPMFMHAQHGWVYAQKWGDWIWMWDYGVGEWFATSASVYPMLYDQVEGSWFWYYEGTASPRWYVKVKEDTVYSEFHGALLPHEMVEMVDSVMGLTGAADDPDNDEPDLMTQVMGYVLLTLIGDPATMECPSLHRSPEVIDIETLPPTVEAGLDFGSGCTPGDSTITMAGGISLVATNLNITDTAVDADIVITADSLSRDGTLLLNGDIVGSVAVVLGLEETTFDVSISIDNLVGVDSTVSGGILVNGSTSTDDEGDLSYATINATLNNFVVDGAEPINGTLSMDMDPVTGIVVEMNAQSASGPVEISLTAVPTDAGGYVLNTTSTADLMGYSLDIDDIVMEPETCETMPISGDIIFRMDGVSYIVTFTGDCEDGFKIRKQ